MITFREFKELYCGDHACGKKLFDLKYGESLLCPKCNRIGFFKQLRLTMPHRFFCNCGYNFSVVKETFMAKSHVSLEAWFIAIYLVLMDPEVKLRTIRLHTNVSQPAAVNMRKLIRKALVNKTLPDIIPK